jgi:hypothetical protein
MKKDFKPQNRGDIHAAIETKQLIKVAPESPRPSDLLQNVKITSADELTANDTALYELLLSSAYENDTANLKSNGKLAETHFISVDLVMPYIGTSSRRDAIKASLRRLANTTISFGSVDTCLYENVQLVTAWLESTKKDDRIKFSFPEPIRNVMSKMPSYAYIELAPLPEMKSRYSISLYKHLALEASKADKWTPDGDNAVYLYGTPEEVAAWAGYQPENGKVAMSKLRERVLKFIETDFANLRTFSVRFKEIYGSGRGRPVEKIEFRLGLKSPSHHMVKMGYDKGEHKLHHVGGVDAPEFRVNSNIWIKAERTFWNERKFQHRVYYHAWLIALQEALDKDPLSPGYTCREYRGQRLLNAIVRLGADEAAFKFCAEEVANPDIAIDNWSLVFEMPDDAREARKSRIEASKHVQTSFHTSKEPAADESESERNDQKTAVPFTTSGFSRPAFSKPVAEQVSYIETTGDIDVSDTDAEFLEDLISNDTVPVSKKQKVEAPVEEVIETEIEEDEDDFGVDDTAAAFLSEIIADDEPGAPSSKLDGVKEIIWSADDELDEEEIKDQVFPILQNYYYDEHDHTHRIKLTIRWWNWGSVVESTFGFLPVSERDIDEITQRLDNERVLHETLKEVEYII